MGTPISIADAYAVVGLPQRAVVPSDFAQYVTPELPDGALVADLEAGVGHDAVYFAQQGHEVSAFGCARPALEQLGRLARRDGLAITPYWLLLDESRRAERIGRQLSPERPWFYSRSLVGGLSPAERANLWRFSRAALVGRGVFHLEFAAARRRRPTAVRPDGVRLEAAQARLDPHDVWREIRASGGLVDCLEVLATPEDPAVCRIRARWPRGRLAA